jgi:hypothetical protein
LSYQRASKEKPKTQTPVNLIADIVQQLASQLIEKGNPTMEDKITNLYHEYHNVNNNSRPSLEEYFSLFRDVMCCFSKILLVVDALDERANDECGDKLLSELRRLQQPKICLLVTSRSPPTFEFSREFDSQLEVRASDEDLSNYITERIHSYKIFSRYTARDPKFEENVKMAIIKKASGM